MASPLFRCKGIDQLLSDSENAEVRLKKTLGWVSLTSLGIGAVIGSGIFTIIGTAIAGQQLQVKSILNAPLLEYLIYHSPSFGRPGAGPAIALSFVLVAIVCGFASVGGKRWIFRARRGFAGLVWRAPESSLDHAGISSGRPL